LGGTNAMVPAILKRTVLLWALVLAACTVQLAPAYDPALVQGLDQTNTQALTLFAELETGSPASDFSTYAPRYAALIGQFDALRQQAMARQIPPLAKRLSGLKLVEKLCKSETDPTACVNTSPASLAQILSTFRRMRDTHRSAGLQPDIVVLFRGNYDPAIAQALTVENALKR